MTRRISGSACWMALAVAGMGLGGSARPAPGSEGESPAAAEAAVDRYAARDPTSLHVPRRLVTRRDYVDLVRPLATGFEHGADHGPYGPRHALLALAVFAFKSDARLGEGTAFRRLSARPLPRAGARPGGGVDPA